jgi:hypothetical protein
MVVSATAIRTALKWSEAQQRYVSVLSRRKTQADDWLSQLFRQRWTFHGTAETFETFESKFNYQDRLLFSKSEATDFV